MTWAVIYAGDCVGIPRTVVSLINGSNSALDIMEHSAPMLAIAMLLDYSQVCLSAIIVGLGK